MHGPDGPEERTFEAQEWIDRAAFDEELKEQLADEWLDIPQHWSKDDGKTKTG